MIWGTKMSGRILLLCVVVASFVLGFFSGISFGGVGFSLDVGAFLPGGESFLPSDRVNRSDIHVFGDRVVIVVGNVSWSEYEDTGSMEPVLGAGANGLQLDPESEADVHVGDIVAYDPGGGGGLVVHRVVRIGSDGAGTYYVLKGDNAVLADPGRVRFSQIRHVLIGVIY